MNSLHIHVHIIFWWQRFKYTHTHTCSLSVSLSHTHTHTHTHIHTHLSLSLSLTCMHMHAHTYPQMCIWALTFFRHVFSSHGAEWGPEDSHTYFKHQESAEDHQLILYTVSPKQQVSFSPAGSIHNQSTSFLSSFSTDGNCIDVFAFLFLWTKSDHFKQPPQGLMDTHTHTHTHRIYFSTSPWPVMQAFVVCVCACACMHVCTCACVGLHVVGGGRGGPDEQHIQVPATAYVCSCVHACDEKHA